MRNTEAEAVVDRRNRRVGEFIQALTEGRGASGVPAGKVTRVTIRLPTPDNPEALLVIKATGTAGDVVAFVGALDIVQAVLTWAAKDRAKGLKWRVDTPWEQR